MNCDTWRAGEAQAGQGTSEATGHSAIQGSGEKKDFHPGLCVNHAWVLQSVSLGC